MSSTSSRKSDAIFTMCLLVTIVAAIAGAWLIAYSSIIPEEPDSGECAAYCDDNDGGGILPVKN